MWFCGARIRRLICFIHDYSKYRRVNFLNHISEVFFKFEEFCAFFKNQTEKSINAVLSDDELENNNFLKYFLKKLGAEFCYSTPYTPQQNGTAKITNSELGTNYYD